MAAGVPFNVRPDDAYTQGTVSLNVTTTTATYAPANTLTPPSALPI